ncbi:hypothetical protein [Acidovorax sp.]|uniref:hypothetical protein n=1 Tax=Acidovorax sp. TaxID=1872122 RepID=UPI002ACE9570|nr:hypothetical protein [Acidovorax sp.]MDZ7863163.1 hypothetical protein [Acidovorax sp.]
MPSSPQPAITVRQRAVQVCLFLVAAIAVFGGTLQMFLGQPDTTPRLDNVHRFMAGVCRCVPADVFHRGLGRRAWSRWARWACPSRP